MRVLYFRGWRLGRLLIFLLGIIFLFGVGVEFGRLAQRAAPVMKREPIYQGRPEVKAVALAINVDWGQEYLPAMNQALTSAGVKATFFITGRWAEQYPDLVKTLAGAGHEIGNHGYAHLHVNNISADQHKQDISRAEAVLASLAGGKPRLYAPPYGESKAHVAASAADLGYRTIMWTVNTGDWLPERTGQQVLQIMTKGAQNGAIFLLHPTAKTASILPEAIRQLKAAGYAIKVVSEII